MEMMRHAAEEEGRVVVQKLPLDLLIPLQRNNSRRFRPQARICEMANSLSLYGQKEALRVYPGEGEDEGKYIIVSGVTRFMAAKVAGWTELDAIIDPTLKTATPLALLTLSRLYNDASQETDMDHAATITDLEEQGYSQEEIMLALGFNTPSRLYRLKAFRELPQAIFEIAAQHPDKVTAEFADILKRAVLQLGEDKAVQLAEELVAENLSKRKLDERIRAECRKIANTPTRSTKERSTVIRLGDEKVGYLSLTCCRDSGERKVRLELILPKDSANNCYAMLENMIQRMQEKC